MEKSEGDEDPKKKDYASFFCSSGYSVCARKARRESLRAGAGAY
jgi:hypothetical protein